MKKLCKSVVVLAAVFGATSALADNNSVFDEPYWKAHLARPDQPSKAELAAGEAATGVRPFRFLDDYNP
jgi:hypothetical protein